MTGVVFSFADGIIHPYYTVALAPAVGALVGMGAATLWNRRSSWGPRVALALALAASAVWSTVLLDRAPTWHPVLRPIVLFGGLGLAVTLLAVPRLGGRGALAFGAAGVVVGLAGPAAYAIDTASTPHSGAIPSAGPAVIGAFGPGGGGAPGGFAGAGAGGAGGFGRRFGTSPTASAAGFGGGPRGGGGFAGPSAGAGPARTGGFGGGGFLNATTPGTAVVRLLETDAGHYTWVAAALGLQRGRRVPAGHRRPGDGHRRVQRHRPCPILAPVRGRRAGRQDPLLHRRGRRWLRRRLHVGFDGRPDHELGRDTTSAPGRSTA